MNRSPPKMRSLARRRGRRGFALLMAIGIIAFIAAAVVVSLRAVASESALQGSERRNREAQFAAEAGLAEAREVVRLMLVSAGGRNYGPIMQQLGDLRSPGSGVNGFVTETGLPSDNAVPWYEVIPWTSYTLQAASAGAAVDLDHNTNNQETYGSDGPILDYPDQLNVRYRVFLVDDDDSNDRKADSNNRVWLVSVGEVTGQQGTQPQRAIIRSLITSGTGAGGGCSPEDAMGADNTGGC
ncbi:hypothetical protein [Myxococcus sp. RHSTA-1-4]|uniref:hypothetical protein n=1 Tax=Myxococcus sp. RHSTA-1-4 TaxID=2874601 RepID=UPI001CBBE619|nr:hypothetical protein [Myxococcus sp. RHSTA-1-4]MBZ4415265.1 hypothetical protein [Myxococcus sp. RHSTA-1-4]